MSSTLSGLVNRGLKSLGLRVARRRPFRDPVQHLCTKSRELGLSTVLDVGANRGQFGCELRSVGYTGRIISFEPLASCHAALLKAAEQDPAWHVAPRAALGAQDGTVTMNVSENLVSSSVLPMVQKKVEIHAPARYVASEEVPLRRLDTLREPSWTAPFALKIDTQGFELEVLKGATQLLRETPAVLLEMSLVTLYEGAAGFAELYAWMEQAGYRCVAITEGFIDANKNEQLQADAMFVRG